MLVDVLLQSDGHQRETSVAEFFDVGSQQRQDFAFGLFERDRRGGLGGDDSGLDGAVFERHGIREIVGVDGFVGVEDIQQELFGFLGACVGDVRSDVDSDVVDAVAGRAILDEHLASAFRIGGESQCGSVGVEHLVPAGGSRGGQHGLGSLAEGLVLGLRQLVDSHRVQLGGGDLPLLDGLQQPQLPLLRREQRRQDRPTNRGGFGAITFDEPRIDFGIMYRSEGFNCRKSQR